MYKRKKILIKTILAILICIGGLVFLISQIKLEKFKDRAITSCALNSNIKEEIKDICETSDSPQDIIEECSKLVCKELSFTAKNNIPHGEANCIGYAQLTSATINHAFQVKRLPYWAKPVVGKVYLFGIDLNEVAQTVLPKKHRPFFKDHDFVEVDLGDKTVFIDSSLQDLTVLTFMQTHINETPH